MLSRHFDDTLNFLKERKNRPHLVIWAAALLLYIPVLLKLYSVRWKVLDYTHAYFILPVSLWLVWRKREELATSVTDARPANWGLAILIPGLLMFIFGWLQEYLFISSLSLIPIISGLVLYLYGIRTLKPLAFPIAYLLLMIPPPLFILDGITLPMRYAISLLTDVTLRAFHYPIIRDGLLFSIKGHEIYMGAPCSGFRSLITMISLGLVYAYISKLSFKKKSALFASVIPLALIGNYLRVLGMCLVTYYYGEAAGHTYHDTSGYVIFMVLVAGMLGVEKLLER